jgi:hypothetical protein
MHKWNLATIQCNREVALRYSKKSIKKSGDEEAGSKNHQEIKKNAKTLQTLIREQSK